MNPLIIQALSLAKDKDQRIGHEQHWFITVEQLNELLTHEHAQTQIQP